MSKLPEHPRCPHCGSYDTERHWGDTLMQAGVGVLGALADLHFLGGVADDETLSKGAESMVDSFSQKYTCNECDRNFTLEESEIGDTNATESLDYDQSREDIVERAAFEMEIEDVFEIEGHGIVITGRISTGCVYNGENITISDSTGPEYHAEVIGIEMFRKLLDRAEEGDNCGLLIKGVNKRDIKPGMIASHVLHIQTKSVKTDDKPTPKGLFMKGLMQQSKRYNCKIPALNDDVVIQLAIKHGIDIREGLRIAQKYDAIERLDAKDKIAATPAQPKQKPDNTKNEETYLEEYRQCLSDGEIPSAEIRLLKKLAVSLGISEERAKELEALCQPDPLTDAEKQYLEEFKACLEDGSEISASTRRLLNRLASSLNLTDDQVSRLEKM